MTVDADDLDALATLLHAAREGIPCGELTRRLDWSLTRLHSALEALRHLGADISSMSGRLRLTVGDELVVERIASGLSARSDVGVTVCRVCASTNDVVREGSGWRLCVAEAQTRGRGRRARSWIQPYALGLVLSLAGPGLRRRPEGLAIAAAVAVAEALGSAGYRGIGLKWPNDLYAGDRKLGGLLVEASGGPNPRIVIGLGINVHAAVRLSDRRTAALVELGPTPDRNALAGHIADALVTGLAQFERMGFADFHRRFAALDILNGRAVSVQERGRTTEGVACGIAADGRIVVETAGGSIRWSAAEISLAAAKQWQVS